MIMYIYIYVTVTLYNITGVLVRIVSNWGISYIHQGHILQILTVHPGFCLPQMGRCVIRLSRFFSPFPAANARLYGFRYWMNPNEGFDNVSSSRFRSVTQAACCSTAWTCVMCP